MSGEIEFADRPQEMVLRGWNKYHRLIWYECPKCELPYDNVYFKKNKLKPRKVFTCELCKAELKIPKYK